FIGIDTCRPILSNSGAAIDTVGVFCDGTKNSCLVPNGSGGLTPAPVNTLISFYDTCYQTGNPNLGATPCGVTPVSLGSTHWIENTDVAQLFFGSPFIGVPRN